MYANKGLSTFSPFSNDFDRLFENWNSPSLYGLRSENTFAPACDIEEADGHYLIAVEMPGFKKDDIRIDMSGNILTISGERQRESDKTDESGRWYSERRFGKFQRSFTLPDGMDVDKVEAGYEDGVLRLVIPKAESVKPKQIKIGSGGTSKFFGKLLSTSKEALRNGNNKTNRDMNETSVERSNRASDEYRKAAS